MTFSVISNGQVLASQEIYVVEVSLGLGEDLANFIRYGTPADAPTNEGWATSSGVALKGVNSGSPTGADWGALVTLTGPGDNLGVNQINVGFIQHINVQTWSGQYAGTTTQLVSSLQGQTYLDMGPDGGGRAVPTSTYGGPPWYSRQAGATFFGADSQGTSAMIESYDTPGMGVPVDLGKDSWPLNLATAANPVTNINLITNFTLDVAASTTSTASGANNSYWAEGRANWTFNGTGAVAAFNNGNMLWEGVGAGTSENPSSFTAVAAPTLENTSGPIFNQKYVSAALSFNAQ